MDLLILVLYQSWREILWYGLWWLPFIAIAYYAARRRGWLGTFGGVLLLGVLLVFIDLHWISKDMREHPEHERSIDVVFWLGVAGRTVLFNLVLVPVTIVGLRRRKPGVVKARGGDVSSPVP